MKRIVALILLIISLRAQAQEIPSVKITDLKTMLDTSTAPIIINFWATWCAPCIEEIPWFERAVKDYRDRGVKLVLVSLDFREDFPERIKEFVRNRNYQSQVLWLNETNADYFCPQVDPSWEGGIPATLFFNRQTGYRHFVGRQLSEDQLQKEIKNLVK